MSIGFNDEFDYLDEDNDSGASEENPFAPKIKGSAKKSLVPEEHQEVEEEVEEVEVEKEEKYHYEDGLKAFVTYLNEGKTSFSEVMYFAKEDPETGLACEIAMQYNDSYAENVTC